jgi:hypothetical protein
MSNPRARSSARGRRGGRRYSLGRQGLGPMAAAGHGGDSSWWRRWRVRCEAKVGGGERGSGGGWLAAQIELDGSQSGPYGPYPGPSGP